MINARRLNGENYGNGVSYRVAVCRKRLRANRTSTRVPVSPDYEVQLIPQRRLAEHSSAPDVANELTARQLRSPQTELLAAALDREWLDVVGEAALEPELIAQEKAGDT